MSKIMKSIERIIQVITIIGCIITVIEAIQMHMYRTKLKNKADEYIEDELALEGNLGIPVKVYSPELEEKEQRVWKLLMVTGIGVIASIILHFINRDY